MNHTKEPWAYEVYRDDGVVHKDGDIIVEDFNTDNIIDPVVRNNNIIRIVECVNACEGIGNPLAFHSKLKEIIQSEYLLKSLYEYKNYYNEYGTTGNDEDAIHIEGVDNLIDDIHKLGEL